MSKDMHVYPYGESWTEFSESSGRTVSCAKGVLHKGMTLRDHFAGLAMQGIYFANKELLLDPGDIAEWSYYQADAISLERDKRKNGLSEGL